MKTSFGLLLIGVTFLAPLPTEASHEAFGIYEDWTSPTIRSDRWRGSEAGGAQEISREVDSGKLRMRYRREGETGSNSGSAFTFQFLSAQNPTTIDQIEAEFIVNSLTVTGCDANPISSQAGALRLTLIPFNDGSSSGPGDRIGDYLAAIFPLRGSNSEDPLGVLRVFAVLGRCNNPGCSSQDSVGTVFFDQTATVGPTFKERIIWDSPNNRFLFGVNDDPNIAVTYDPTINPKPAVLPFAELELNHTTANCTAAPTVADVDVQVGQVRTNTSGIIP